MGSGGARNRSGPPADPKSGRSERRGVSFTALPSSGYDGPVPRFPLPRRVVTSLTVGPDGSKSMVLDEGATKAVASRESALWQWAWSTPQAAAWSQPSESWRLMTVAMWVRTYVLCESSEATAADKGSLHRFADQIGLTPAGLRENGWTISVDEVSQRAETRKGKRPAEEARPRRLRGV